MRYARQEILLQIGRDGQEKLKRSTATIVGVGALGTVSAELLARAGIGRLVLIDRDIVEESNLQCQTLFTEGDVGRSKAVQAREHLRRINSSVEIEAYPEDLTGENAEQLITGDVIIDGTDNMETRFVMNDVAKKMKMPWVHAAVVQDRGSVMPMVPDGVCLSCVLHGRRSDETCETAGVWNTAVCMVASLQVTEAIKLLLGKHKGARLFSLNVWDPKIEQIEVKQRSDCLACKGKFEYLEGRRDSEVVKLCGTGMYQVRFKERLLDDIRKQVEKVAGVTDLGYALKLHGVTVFRNRALVHAKTEEEARSLFAKYLGC